MNLILPLARCTIAFMYPHDLLLGKVVVEEVAPDSPAAVAGIENGDQLLSINGKTVNNIADLQRYIQINLGRETDILVEHSDSSTENINLIPRWRPPEGEGAIGIRVSTLDATIVRRSEPPWRAAPLAATEYVETFTLFKNAALGAITGSQSLQVAGPVGIAQVTGEIAQAGVSPLLEFAAFLSINLAILNILPLPALDGGRIGFVVLEKLRHGKRVAPRTQGLVHLIGFVIFIGVIVAVTYNDILRIASGGSLLP
ncbi:MAG: site-2 protease family protein, partial [Dehalococcoidia bacterium]